MPSTFRPALHIPAMLSSDPFGFASGVILPVGGRIPEDDPLVALQFRERRLIAKVIAFHVPDGNGQNFTLAACVVNMVSVLSTRTCTGLQMYFSPTSCA